MRYKSLMQMLIICVLTVNCSVKNPNHLRHDENIEHMAKTTISDSISELYYRNEDGSIAKAPIEEVELVNDYLSKNQVKPGQSLVILSTTQKCVVGETVSVIHIYQNGNSGGQLYINGPKEIFDEYIDGVLVSDTAPVQDYPWTLLYDGRVIEAPGSDCGFDITRYSFSETGEHTIVWKSGGLASNVLVFNVQATE